MGKRILGYILCALGFIIILFFKKYAGNSIPYPVLILPTGAILLFIGVILLWVTPTYGEYKATQKLKNSETDLQENGEKIQVDLTQCEIKENDYYDTQLVAGKRSSDLSTDPLIRNAEIEKQTEVDQAVFIYTHRHSAHEEKFNSPVIHRTGDDLKIALFLQKTTTLYVDKTDRSKYYFDLDFLKREE